MSSVLPDPRLRVLLITPEGRPFFEIEAATEAALRGGIRAVMLRDKKAAGRDVLHAARRLREMTTAFGALLLVNGRVDCAAAVGADGVQLGVRELPPPAARRLLGPAALIGYSAHAPAECAAIRGVDWMSYSPIYETPGKGRPVGVEGLREAAWATSAPLIALGGIAVENIAPALKAGAQGVSVIRSVYDAMNVQEAAAKMVAAVQEWYDAKSGG